MAVPILHQVVCEVRYGRGFKYYDHCGSLMLSLNDTLGPTFVGSVPQMQFGLLVSQAERMDVRYGPGNVSLSHGGPATAARLIQLAPRVWRAVAEKLDVKRHVVRCGARFIWIFPAASPEESDRIFDAGGLTAPTPPTWDQAFPGYGLPQKQQVTARVLDKAGRAMRVIWSTAELTPPANAKEEAQETTELLPKFATMLDLDFVLPGEGTETTLSHDDLGGLLKHAWLEASGAADRMKDRLVDAGFYQAQA